jgi:hypothetical protein
VGGLGVSRNRAAPITLRNLRLLQLVARDTVNVPTPPEAAFDRYFRGLNPKQQKIYEGKYDLEQLTRGPLKVLLLGLQSGLNLALANERSVPEHRDHPPFHVDYIRSEQANALAFRYDGYSFIGLTIPLVNQAAQLCTRLCNSIDLLSALGLNPTQEISEALGAILLKILLYFVVSHEYTHIVHGHPLSEVTDSEPINEILMDGRAWSLDEQTLEADADSYAIYHIMSNWIEGVERSPTISSLAMDAAFTNDQDVLLFGCIVVAIGAYFVLHPVPQLDAKNVYELRHPPHPVRLNLLMETAIGWCKQNRPGLEDYMTPQRFDSLLSIVANLVWEFDDHKIQDWRSQISFLKTHGGASYITELQRRKDAYRASL